MARWMIEKSGSGIEKSGSGIEKAGSGIEKSGSGIEKAGSGIEKAGSGIKRSLMAIAISALAFNTGASADDYRPEGSLMITADNGRVTVSWSIDGSVFAGVSSLSGSFSRVDLTEIGLVSDDRDLLVAGSGTGKEVAGSGTGIEVAGSGTGKEVAGSGTGIEVAGSGTGVEVAGSGTGQETDGIADASTILVAGSGTGSEAISITLPQGTGMHMEISMNCATATVSVLDSGYGEVVSFENVPVIGNTGLCSGGGSSGSYSRNLPKMR